MNSNLRFGPLALALSLLSACAMQADEAEIDSTEVALGENACDDNVFEAGDFDRSVVVHNEDLSTEDWALFSLERTLQQVIDSNASIDNDPTTPEALLASLLDGLNISDEDAPMVVVMNPDSGLPVEVQDIDATSAAFDIDSYEAIAFFNRLDLAPAGWSNCGEHRIVYEHTSLSLWLIFEAKLPNPALQGPEVGAAGHPFGCRPVVQFWDELADDSLTSAEIADRLEEFYYEGFDDLQPVVQHAHYAAGLGQVRTNHISIDENGGDPWQLRELRTDIVADGSSTFVVDTVKGNALAELYFDGLPSWIDNDSTEATLFEEMQSDYLRGFVPIEGEAIIDENLNGIPDRLEELLAPELHGGPVIGGFGLSVDNQFNEFMSASNSSDNPANGSDEVHPALSAGLPTALEDAGVTNVTAEQILTRIDTQTCGGCHETSAGGSIGFDEDGGDIDWPMEVTFVHARKAQLSEALIDHFLPARMGHLRAARAIVTHPGDLNLDGTINVSDLLMLLQAWGSTEGGIGDVNGDCLVNVMDLLTLIGDIGWTDPTDAAEARSPAAPGPRGRDDDVLREEAPRPEVARDDGTDTSEVGTDIDRAEREVAQASNQRERDQAIRDLRDLRVEAGEREAAQEGALIRVRPTH